jgi:hypothetical protein
MTDPPDRARRPARPRARLDLAALIGAVALPVLVTGVRVVRSGWVPAIDDGTIATRAYDVWSRHPPLVGQFSLAGNTADHAAHSPGPMLYWLVSLPARTGWPGAIPLTMAVLNAALLGVCVWLAHRRGGTPLAAVVAVALAFLVRAYGPVALAEIWNPWAALVPFTALVFVAWSVADGDRFLLPGAVLLASFVMQTHLTYVFPTIGLLAVAVAGGWGRWAVAGVRNRVGSGRSEPDDATVGSRRAISAPLVLAAVIGVACWAVPVYEQFTRDPGNMTLILDSNAEAGARGGGDAARSSLWRAIGIPPRWVRSEANPAAEILEGLVDPGVGATLGAGVALAVLAAAAVIAVRRRDGSSIRLAGVAGVLLVALLIVAASLPLRSALVAGYTFRWFALAGLITWLAVARVAARHLVPEPSRRRLADLGAAHPAWPLAVAGLVVVGGLLVPTPDSAAWSYRPAEQVGDLVEGATRPGGTYLVAQPGRFDIAFTPAIAYRLRTTGRHPVLRNPHAEAFGEQYAVRGDRHCDGLILLDEPGVAVAEGAVVVGTVAIPDGPDLPPTMRLSILPDRSPTGRC